MAQLIPPTNELNSIIRGDLDILAGYDTSSNGFGTIFVREGGLYVNGLTDLDATTINTNDGLFDVLGPNKIQFNISGGATSSIEFTAEDTSFWTTTAGTLTLQATATDSNGKVNVIAAGTGPNSILVDAQNTTSGQITIQSAGASTSTDAVKILASDTTDGNILIQARGNFTASNPAIKLFSDNATSGQILLESAGAATTSDAVKILASDTTDGNVLIQARGNYASSNPAIKLYTDNATSGQILLESAGDSATVDAIYLHATGSAGGNVNIVAAGDSGAEDAIHILASGSTSGNILMQANSTASNATRILSLNGGIDIDAVGIIAVDTTDLVTGVTIATATSGVPVTIGTASSLTTIVGDLLVSGTTTTVNTETLTVEDNIILINSGLGELGIDGGIAVRRYQTANNSGAGDVTSSPVPIQESGAFQAGSATPGTLVLSLFASDTTDFYVGWWIKITSGTGIDQVRRIKSYNASTKTASLYVTADNTTAFFDGLNLTTAPAAADTYNLYSDSYQMSFYSEGTDNWTFANVSKVPDPISSGGISTADIQNYQQISSGAHNIYTQIYRNAFGSASGTTVTFTLLGHTILAGQKVKITDSADFTPAIPSGPYTVTSTPTADTFTVTVPTSTVSIADSSVTLSLYHTSVVYANVIEPHDPEFGSISIPGLSCFEDIIIPKTSTSYFFVNLCTNTYGAVILFIADLFNTDGTFGVFCGARSSSTGNGTISRLASAKGADGQRIDADWLSGQKIKIRHSPAGVGSGNYTYRVRVYYAIQP
jgi:hypothetical protein